MRYFLLPSLADIVFIAVFVVALAFGAQMLSLDSDLGRHLTLGNYILDHRTVPTRDILSHTLAGRTRPPYEWLSQVLFALSHRLLNLDGVILFTAIIIASAFTVTFQFANTRSGSPVIAMFITLLAAGASSLHWLPRPHIITLLFLAIWIQQLEQLRKNESAKWFILPGVMLLWANLHGGFIFGILAWIAYFAGWLLDRQLKRTDIHAGNNLFIAGIASVAASIVTPDLWRNWEAVLNNRSVYVLSRTVETMPPDLTDVSVLPFTLLLILSAPLLFLRRKNLPSAHVFLLAGLGAAALLMGRNIPLFAVAAAPILSERIGHSLTGESGGSRFEARFAGFRRNTAFIFPIALVLLTTGFFANHFLRTGRAAHRFNPQVFPVQAADWLDSYPMRGNMFNEFNWGGYLLYRSRLRHPVFVDSQSDFYGEDLLRDYEQILTAQEGWDILLLKYDVDWVIVSKDGSLPDALRAEGWRQVYLDEIAVILTRGEK